MKLNSGLHPFYLLEKPCIYAESALRGLQFIDPCIAKSVFFVKMSLDRMRHSSKNGRAGWLKQKIRMKKSSYMIQYPIIIGDFTWSQPKDLRREHG